MNQCVPSWDLDDNSAPSKMKFLNHSNSPQDVNSLDYEVAELTWENGQLAMHGLGVPRVINKLPTASSSWDKPRAGGTLESIVNQATCHLPPNNNTNTNTKELVPWFEHHREMVNPVPTITMDALVPCSHETQLDGVSTATRVGSCVGGCRSKSDHTSWERELGGPGFTSTSPDNTTSVQEYTKTSADDRDSRSLASDSKADDEGKRRDNGKSSVSTKRSRAAAIHNQSERKRRDKINQRMKTLQKLVPSSSKSDKASMLDEVIDYLKQLQAQVHMMSRMNMPSMMLPLAMQQQQQQQLQMSMMGMAMGMGMGMGVMDINTINRPPAADHCLPPAASVMPDPLAALFACQSQPMTIDAYSRLAAMYQQLQQQPPSKS